ncbi:MAG: c-type cytochrome [Anaerolineales bacterium]|nr:c-type cytochrome [Anaerolineales bacterium]
MKSKIFVSLFFILLTLAVGLVACGAPEPTPIGDATVGKTKFEGTCVSCHGPDAKGLPNLGKDLTTSEFFRTTSDLDLVTFVSTGRPTSDPANTTGVDMPPKGGNPALSEQDIKDIISYIRTLQQQ